ncbi:MAG: hydroxymyristoyl-ACP dehydratase [Flavobacteriaceae bacterium]|nr:hydroxymyristoyl-ACP dehydratase [Flavobacteriaceae bacterium]
MKPHESILAQLPYQAPFLFVDGLNRIDDMGVEGYYTFTKDADFYNGHFKQVKVTPGVLLTECCAQIGLVCLGIHLLRDSGLDTEAVVGLSSTEMEFLKPVYPSEKVRVVSEKVYFRFQKLKCRVKMYDSSNTLVCRGTISGMLTQKSDHE